MERNTLFYKIIGVEWSPWSYAANLVFFMVLEHRLNERMNEVGVKQHTSSVSLSVVRRRRIASFVRSSFSRID